MLEWSLVAVVLLGLGPLALLYFITPSPYWRGLYKLRGPPSTSLLLGLAADIIGRDWDKGQYPEPSVSYARQYGMVYYNRIVHMHRASMLDPIGLKHVLMTRSDNYPRDHLARTLFHRMFRGVGLLSSYGAAHTKMRKQLAPHFSAVQLQRFLPIFQHHARHFVTSLPTSTPINMLEKLTQLTLDVIGVSAFGFAFGAVDGRLSRELQAFDDVKMPSSFLVNLGIVFLPFWDYLPFATVQRRVHATNTIQDTVYRVIDAKLQAPVDRKVTDLLDLLLLSGTSAADARVHVTTFMQAGHETTSGTLAWVLVQIATHADVANRVYTECRDVLRRHQEDEMTSDVLAELPYLTAVIQETLRLYPTGPSLADRIALEDDTVPLVDGTSVFIPKGTQLSFDLLAMHRNPMFWTDPDSFCPDRFLNGHPLQVADKALRGGISLAFVYLPFGAGVNHCIGQRFALLQMQVQLLYLLGTFHVTLTPNANVNPKRDLVTMHPTHLEVLLSQA